MKFRHQFIGFLLASCLFLQGLSQAVMYLLKLDFTLVGIVVRVIVLASAAMVCAYSIAYALPFRGRIVFLSYSAFWMLWVFTWYRNTEDSASLFTRDPNSMLALALMGSWLPGIAFGYTYGKNASEACRDVSSWLVLLTCLSYCYKYGSNLGAGFYRLTGTTEHGMDEANPLQVGYAGSLAIAMAIEQIKFSRSRKWRLAFSGALVGTSVICMALAASRGPIIAAMLLFLIHILQKLLRGRGFVNRFLVILASAGGAVGILFLLMIFNISGIDRLRYSLDSYNSGDQGFERLAIWGEAIDSWLESPILGKQIEVFKMQTHAHNLLLESLMSSGILGCVLVLIVLTYGAKSAARQFIRQDSWAWLGSVFFVLLTMMCFSSSMVLAPALMFSSILLAAIDHESRDPSGA